MSDCANGGRNVYARPDALGLACEHIAAYGSCPYDEYFYEGMDADCGERCSADVDHAECWRRYFEERSEDGV